MEKLLNYRILLISLLITLLKINIARAGLIIQDDFESGTYSPKWSECSFPNNSVVVKGTAHSGNYSFRIYYQRDEDASALNIYGLTFDELYVRFWQMYPTGFYQRNLKQSNVFHSAGGSYEGSIIHSLWGPSPTMQTTFYIEDEAIWVDFPVPPGEWFEIAYYIKYNTPGKNDGIYRLWRNKKLIYERNNVIYRTINRGADSIWIGGNYSGAGVNPIPFYRYIDDICIGNRPSDCGDDFNPPAPPVNLRILE